MQGGLKARRKKIKNLLSAVHVVHCKSDIWMQRGRLLRALDFKSGDPELKSGNNKLKSDDAKLKSGNPESKSCSEHQPALFQELGLDCELYKGYRFASCPLGFIIFSIYFSYLVNLMLDEMLYEMNHSIENRDEITSL